MKLLRLSIKEIRKKKFFSILILLVCVIAMADGFYLLSQMRPAQLISKKYLKAI